MSNRSVTHSPTCHLWHPECARVRVAVLVKSLEEAEGLGMCACYYREWLGPNSPRHDAECLFRVLDKWQLRGVWKGEEEDSETV